MRLNTEPNGHQKRPLSHISIKKISQKIEKMDDYNLSLNEQWYINAMGKNFFFFSVIETLGGRDHNCFVFCIKKNNKRNYLSLD